ncbi:MAG: CBS domain-containing protein [Polyangiales bacterium]
MNVSEMMTQDVRTCGIHDNLARAAQVMWEADCGCLPVIDDGGRVVGMVTDRDVCMSSYIEGKRFEEIPVSIAMSKHVFTVGEYDQLETAEAIMRQRQIRRLPVVDLDGRLRGLLSLNDLARHSEPTEGRLQDGLSSDSVARTLAAISQKRALKESGYSASTSAHQAS